MSEKIATKGDLQAVRNNEAVLRELFKTEYAAAQANKAVKYEDTSAKSAAPDADGTKHQRVTTRSTQQSEYTFDDFKTELLEDWDTALKKNFKQFEGKFQLFYDRLEGNLHKYMREESDRVISDLSKGPHDLIRDPVRCRSTSSLACGLIRET